MALGATFGLLSNYARGSRRRMSLRRSCRSRGLLFVTHDIWSRSGDDEQALLHRCTPPATMLGKAKTHVSFLPAKVRQRKVLYRCKTAQMRWANTKRYGFRRWGKEGASSAADHDDETCSKGSFCRTAGVVEMRSGRNGSCATQGLTGDGD